MKLRGHMDNVKSVILNAEGTQVNVYTTNIFPAISMQHFPTFYFVYWFYSVCLVAQMVQFACGHLGSNAVLQHLGYMNKEYGLFYLMKALQGFTPVEEIRE